LLRANAITKRFGRTLALDGALETREAALEYVRAHYAA